VKTRRDTRPDFEEFVVVRSDRLLRTAYLLTRDPARAEDLLQTALTRAWFAWKRLDEQPEPYVRTILVDTYATWWRRRRRGERPAGDPPEPRSAVGTGPETRHDLWVALGRLPRRQRAVVVLRFFDDLTEEDTADVLSCSVGTVRSRTAKALARLRVDPERLDAGDRTRETR
jgi:RNA polymerase sigma-70 factor (sigma-E family)